MNSIREHFKRPHDITFQSLISKEVIRTLHGEFKLE